ncbi:MAG: arginine deiminase [Turicibacter sp.]|nr:arginine deiminase [Turicibacter sp.]
MGNPIKIQSEIGKLKTVVLRRPGLEIENLTPDYLGELLFEEIPYLHKIQEEHDYFADALRQQGTEVLYVDELLAEALTTDVMKEEFLTAILKQSNFLYGYTLDKVKEYLIEFPTRDMINKIMSGVRKDELINITMQKSLLPLAMHRPFYVSPMPNLYFTRDPSACIGDGIVFSKMKESARRRESLFMKFIVDYHEKFKTANVPVWVDGLTYPFSIEGGDILVLSKEVVAIGISQRTSVAAIEHISKNLFANQSEIKKVLAVDIPKSRAFMHLDTVFTMLDRDKFSIHPRILDRHGEIDSYTIEAADSDSRLRITHNKDILMALKSVLRLTTIELIPCGGGDAIAAPREQWSDGTNTLALAPGVVMTYDRNYVTNKLLRQRGVEVIEIPSSELSRGRGGPRCMSMPIFREDVS